MALELIIPDNYNYLLLLDACLAMLCMLVGFVVVEPYRRKVFN